MFIGMSNTDYINKITYDDCRKHLKGLENNSIDLFLSDIPYGIGLDDWDVLHRNTNSALLGSSPAQAGKSGFKRRGKPLNGWNEADRKIGLEYYEWCLTWTKDVFPVMKPGSSLFIFGARRTIHRAINAMEDSGFILRDVLAWKKQNAHHRAQRLSIVLERRNLTKEGEEWKGWRLGNLAPIYEPIAWFFKPYDITITDNILEYKVGAMNTRINEKYHVDDTNLLEFWFDKNEERYHEAQKPLSITKYLIELTTREGQTILVPFIGSGTTAVAAKMLVRPYIGFEIDEIYSDITQMRLGNCNRNGLYQPKMQFTSNT